MNEQVNIPLLRKAVEWAEAEAAKPRELCEWVQERYVLPLPGSDHGSDAYNDALALSDRAELGKSAQCGTCFCVAGYVASLTTPVVMYHQAEMLAARALGLTPAKASRLFAATNSIADVRRIAEDLAGERL